MIVQNDNLKRYKFIIILCKYLCFNKNIYTQNLTKNIFFQITCYLSYFCIIYNSEQINVTMKNSID